MQRREDNGVSMAMAVMAVTGCVTWRLPRLSLTGQLFQRCSTIGRPRIGLEGTEMKSAAVKIT